MAEPPKYLHRPLLVHLLKSVTGTSGVTRCGIVYDAKDRPPTRTTAWASEVTCEVCDPT